MATNLNIVSNLKPIRDYFQNIRYKLYDVQITNISDSDTNLSGLFF